MLVSRPCTALSLTAHVPCTVRVLPSARVQVPLKPALSIALSAPEQTSTLVVSWKRSCSEVSITWLPAVTRSILKRTFGVSPAVPETETSWVACPTSVEMVPEKSPAKPVGADTGVLDLGGVSRIEASPRTSARAVAEAAAVRAPGPRDSRRGRCGTPALLRS